MIKAILAGLLTCTLLSGHAWAAGGQSVVVIPGVVNGACGTWPTCPALPNDITHPFYFAPSTASVFNLGTLNGAALDSSLQSILALTPAKNGDGGALSHITNFPATQPVSAAALPLPANAAQEGGGNLAAIASNTALHAGTMVQTSVSCGTTSTTLLAASAATQYVGIKVPSTAANIVWVNYTGAAAITAAPSEDIGIGQKVSWTAGPNGFLPTTQINCIASSATTVTLEYK